VFCKPGKAGFSANSITLIRGSRAGQARLTEVKKLVPRPEVKVFSNRWLDIVALELPQGVWAAVGARTLALKDFAQHSDGPLEVFGHPASKLLVSTGSVIQDKSLETTMGVFKHTCNTAETFSGSPIITLVNGTPKLVGMHLAGGDGVAYNLGMTSKAIMHVFRKYFNFPIMPKAASTLFQLFDTTEGASDYSGSYDEHDSFADFEEDDYDRRIEEEREDEYDDFTSDSDSGGYNEEQERIADEKDQADEMYAHAKSLLGGDDIFIPDPSSDSDDDDRRYRRPTVPAAAPSRKTKGPRWADITDEALSAITEEELELFMEVFGQLVMKFPQYDGWLPRAMCWRILGGKARSNAAIASLVDTDDLQVDKGGHWIGLPSSSAFEVKSLETDESSSSIAGPMTTEIPLPFSAGVSKAISDVRSVPDQPPTTILKPSSSPAVLIPAAPAVIVPAAPTVISPVETKSATPAKESKKSKKEKPKPKTNKKRVRFRDQALGEIPRLAVRVPAPRSDWAKTLPYSSIGQAPAAHWARHRSECKPLLPVVPLSEEHTRALSAWMRGDWNSLSAFRGVGARSLLEHPGFSEFKKYMEAGRPRFTEQGFTSLANADRSVRNALGSRHAAMRGVCSRSYGQKKAKKELSPEFLAALDATGAHWNGKTLREALDGYCLPPSGASAILQSYKGQCERQVPGNWDKLFAKTDFQDIFEEFVSKYPATQGLEASPMELIDRYLDGVDPTKSTGWASRYLPGTKGVWATTTDGRERLTYLAMCRFALRIAEGDNLAWISPEDMVLAGCKDPLEIFVKMEAHTKEKAKKNRWRLIWTTSVVDSACQDVMHHRQNKADIVAYSDGSLNVQAVGLGHHDDGIKRLGEVFDSMTQGTKSLKGSDASGWDLSVSRDAIVFDAERRIRLLTKAEPVARDLLLAEAMTNSAHVLVIGEALWSSDFFGITATGIPSTSAQNSSIRSFTLRACGADDATAAGDDETHTGEVDPDLLLSTGCLTKEGSEWESGPKGPISFTSHSFRKSFGMWFATFDNLAKMLAHLDLRREPGKAPSTDVTGGMLFALRHSPVERKIFEDVVKACGWTLGDEKDCSFEDL